MKQIIILFFASTTLLSFLFLIIGRDLWSEENWGSKEDLAKYSRFWRNLTLKSLLVTVFFILLFGGDYVARLFI